MTGKCLRCSEAEYGEMSGDSEFFSAIRFSLRDQTIDLDQSWHGIHYLLTGSPDPGAYPLDFLLAGGLEVGEGNASFGAPRAFSPDEVQEIWRALEPITTDFLKAQFSAEALSENQVYPQNGWDTSSDSDFTDYLSPNFSELREFVETAAQARQAVVVYLT